MNFAKYFRVSIGIFVLSFNGIDDCIHGKDNQGKTSHHNAYMTYGFNVLTIFIVTQ